jgi:hypothetical protein
MRASSLFLATFGLAALVSCSDDGGSSVPLGTVIRVNDASEEVLELMAEASGKGSTTVDDAKAFAILAPAAGASLLAATPSTFEWAKPATARHGISSGDFVWMKLSGGGLAQDIDVIAVDVASWTPSAADWELISSATGPITVTMTSAYVMSEVIKDGPYTPTATTTFTVVH